MRSPATRLPALLCEDGTLGDDDGTSGVAGTGLKSLPIFGNNWVEVTREAGDAGVQTGGRGPRRSGRTRRVQSGARLNLSFNCVVGIKY